MEVRGVDPPSGNNITPYKSDSNNTTENVGAAFRRAMSKSVSSLASADGEIIYISGVWPALPAAVRRAILAMIEAMAARPDSRSRESDDPEAQRNSGRKATGGRSRCPTLKSDTITDAVKSAWPFGTSFMPSGVECS